MKTRNLSVERVDLLMQEYRWQKLTPRQEETARKLLAAGVATPLRPHPNATTNVYLRWLLIDGRRARVAPDGTYELEG